MADQLKPVYLLRGSDRPKITRALDRLRGRFDDNAIELVSALQAGGEEVVAACNAVGLFSSSEGKLVVVEDVDGRPGTEGRLVGGWKAVDLKAIVAYVGAPAPGSVLALVARELKADSPLGKACAKAGAVLSYDVSKRKLPEWVAEQFGRFGGSADAAACRLLVELVGDGLDELTCEIDKLVTWAAGEPIGAADVAVLSAGRAEASHFALTDAWGRRDLPAALSACESLLERSGHPRARELPRMVGQLTKHVTQVRACQRLAEEGLRARDVAPRLKMHPFTAEKALGQAENFSPDELRDVVVRLAKLDNALKGGSRLAADLELERALIEITRPRTDAAHAA